MDEACSAASPAHPRRSGARWAAPMIKGNATYAATHLQSLRKFLEAWGQSSTYRSIVSSPRDVSRITAIAADRRHECARGDAR